MGGRREEEGSGWEHGEWTGRGDRVGHGGGGGVRMGGRREEEGSGWEHGEWTEFDSFEIQFTSTTTIIPVSSL